MVLSSFSTFCANAKAEKGMRKNGTTKVTFSSYSHISDSANKPSPTLEGVSQQFQKYHIISVFVMLFFPLIIPD